MALMALYNINKHLAVVANCENVLNYKMSNVESLYTGTISAPQFKPLWAPIDGRVINVSVRLKM
jgi:iron complex outermembrane receptor protein/outer membrane receptor for ferrienterochelin and colicins